MKLTGWCMKCRQIKRVTVKLPRPGAVQTGICDKCSQPNDQKGTT